MIGLVLGLSPTSDRLMLTPRRVTSPHAVARQPDAPSTSAATEPSSTAAAAAVTVVDAAPLPVGVARPLPTWWPELQLPTAAATPLAHQPHVPPDTIAAIEAAEGEAQRRLFLPTEASSPMRTQPKKRGKARAAVLVQRRQDREAANQVGKMCSCGKLDTDKHMLQCDGCDTWFHGECEPSPPASSRPLRPCALRPEP